MICWFRVGMRHGIHGQQRDSSVLARSQTARVAFFHCLRRHATPNVFLHCEGTADAEHVCFLIGKLEWRVFIACDDMRHPLFLQPADRRLGRVLRHDPGVHVLAFNQPIGAWGVSTVTSSSYTFLTDEMVKPRVTMNSVRLWFSGLKPTATKLTLP